MRITRRFALLPALAAVAAPTMFMSGCGQSEAWKRAEKLRIAKNEANKAEVLLASEIYKQAGNISTILATLIVETDLHLEFKTRDKARALQICTEISSVRGQLDKELFSGAKEPSVFGSDAENLQKLLDLIRQGIPIIDKVLKDSPEYSTSDSDFQKVLDSYSRCTPNIKLLTVSFNGLVFRHDSAAHDAHRVEKLSKNERYQPIWGFTIERFKELDWKFIHEVSSQGL